MQKVTIHLAQTARIVIAITCMVLGIAGLLLPVLPGIPLLLIAVWLLVSGQHDARASALDPLRVAALRVARGCLSALEILISVLSPR